MNALFLVASLMQAPTATVEIIPSPQIITPGTQITYAIKFRPAPGWHLYYENPGDSGMPPSVDWELPEGWTATPLRFPAPHVIETDGLISYGYEEPFSLVGTIEVPDDLRKNGPVNLKGNVRWMACQTLCKVDDADVTLSWLFNATGGFVPNDFGGALGEAMNALPKPLPGGSVMFDDKQYHLTIPIEGEWRRAVFYCAASGVIANASFEAKKESKNANFELKQSEYASEVAKQLKGIIVVWKGDNQEFYSVDLPVGQR